MKKIYENMNFYRLNMKSIFFNFKLYFMKTKLIFLGVLTFCLLSCVKNKNSNKLTDYKFEITGNFGSLSLGSDVILSNAVMFTDANGNNHKLDNIESGWTYSWKQQGKKPINITYVSTSGKGDATINLYKDNKLIKTITGYGGATASILGEY